MEQTMGNVAEMAAETAVEAASVTAEEPLMTVFGEDFSASTEERIGYLAQCRGVDAEAYLSELLQEAYEQQRTAHGEDPEAWKHYCEQIRTDVEERRRACEKAAKEAEWEELTRFAPEITAPSQVPQEVIEIAEAQQLSLADAYARFLCAELKAANDQLTQQVAAAVQSVGSLAGDTVDFQPEQSAFSRAFRQAVG